MHAALVRDPGGGFGSPGGGRCLGDCFQRVAHMLLVRRFTTVFVHCYAHLLMFIRAWTCPLCVLFCLVACSQLVDVTCCLFVAPGNPGNGSVGWVVY